MTLKIGNLFLDNNLLAAPIAGFSEAGFRKLCGDYGAALTYTEMVSAKGLCFNNKGTEELLRTVENKGKVAVQIFGGDPEYIYRACGDDRLAKFDLIDINMGCPVKKVFGNGEGSALMKNPQLIAEIVAAAKEGSKKLSVEGATPKAVTVKLRAGIELGKPLATECALAAERGGADAVTVHPRFKDQLYSGAADHRITREVKQSLKIPVIANGDIVDLNSLRHVMSVTNADAFMIARGALGRPYIFSEFLNKNFVYDAKETIFKHIGILLEALPEKVVANQIKLHLCYYARGSNNAKAVRSAVAAAKELHEILAVIEKYFD